MKHADPPPPPFPPIHRSPKREWRKHVRIKAMKRTKRESEKCSWFNQPFNTNVTTNVAKTTLTLIDKHFPKGKRLSKIFNRNTIKVSYNCLPNVKQTIANNNDRLLQLHRMKESTQDSKLCTCRQKKLLPT